MKSFNDMTLNPEADKNRDTIYDCIIIGAGISGIAFSHYLDLQKKTSLILEKEEKPGGQIKTGYSEKYPHFWYELGAHTIYRTYEYFQYILKDNTKDSIIQTLLDYKYVLYKKGKLKSLFSGIWIFPLLLNIPKYIFIKKRNRTVRQYYKGIVGRANYDRFLSKAFRAVICQDPDNYPAEMLLKKRDWKDEFLPRKYTFVKGFSDMLETIIKNARLNVKTSSEVISVEMPEGNEPKRRFKITTCTGDIYYTENVTLATDPQTTARLIKDLDKGVADMLASIPLFRSESLNVILPKEKVPIKEIAGIIPMSDEFLSVVSRDTVEDPELRGFTFHFQKGKSEEEKLAIICKVLEIQSADILEKNSTEHVLPSVRVQHVDLEEQLKGIRKVKNIYPIGNYFYGLAIEDCVHRARNESERLILER